MTSIAPEQLLNRLQWRYAVRVFEPGRTIPEATWEALEEALVLTPSSYGLQPWHFLILTDRGLRERLVGHAWGQRQVADCSHFVVFCIRQDLGEAEIDRYLRRIGEVRGTPMANLAGFRQMMVGSLVEGPVKAVINEWATRQVYIALGNFMTAAAMVGVDTCPMEGFEPGKFDEVLGLGARGLASVVCCAAGYRGETDRQAGLPKVRYPRSEVLERR
ncbi:MAG: NAD(P)H-dependent oxidoreductase [Verrucomicrobiae bacterium]|nr:NAD(P)H-dependent oxidoreductase [Verrucomicrobiae bacterium]